MNSKIIDILQYIIFNILNSTKTLFRDSNKETAMPLTFSVMHIGDPTKEPTFDNIVICSEELPLGPGHGGVVLDHIVIDDTPHTHDKGVTTPLWIEGLLAFSKANASIAATHQALKHLMIAAWTAAWHARDKKAPSAS